MLLLSEEEFFKNEIKVNDLALLRQGLEASNLFT